MSIYRANLREVSSVVASAVLASGVLACFLLQGCQRSPPPPHALQDASDSAAAASAGLKARLSPEQAAATDATSTPGDAQPKQ